MTAFQISSEEESMEKISQWGLNTVLAMNLIDLPIFEDLLSRVRLGTDADGKVLDYQIDNIKSSIKVAFRLSLKQDSEISGKLKRALVFLLNYGTEASSDDIRKFLSSPEGDVPLILTDLPASSRSVVIGNAMLPFLKEERIHGRQISVDDFGLFMRQTKQDFSA